MAKKKALSSKDLRGLIRRRFDDNGQFVVLEEVSCGTGYARAGRVDMAVFNLWPSKGLTRMAFELKISRSDFTRELLNPEKNKWAKECFHEFWFVAPTDVIKEEELPEGAGWMRPNGDSLAIVRHAVRKNDPITDDILLAALMRASYKGAKEMLRDGIKEAVKKDDKVQKWKKWYEGTKAFFENHDIHEYEIDLRDTAIEVAKALENINMDDMYIKERDQILGMLDAFHNEVSDLFTVFSAIACRSLLAKDKAGEFVNQRWHKKPETAVENLKELATKKSARSNPLIRNRAKKALEFARTILNVPSFLEEFEASLEGNDGLEQIQGTGTVGLPGVGDIGKSPEDDGGSETPGGEAADRI